MSHVFVIAEAACTWRTIGEAHPVSGQEYDCLRELADRVKQVGADALKIQWCSDGAEMGQRRGVAESYPLLQFDQDFLPTFHDLCVDRELEPMCTVFLPQDVLTVAPFVARYKVASLEAMSWSIHRAYAEQASRKPLYVSTGCMTADEVVECALLWADVRSKLLHCVTAYPAPLSDCHLAWAATEPYIEGWSDHTKSLIAGAVAVGAGLTVIEKHVRPSPCDTRNPDFSCALEWDAFRAYVEHIRQAEMLSGKPTRAILPCEQGFVQHRVVI